MPNGTIPVAPVRPGRTIVALTLIYALTIASCFMVNIIVRHWPIGTATGAAIDQNYWLDNVTWCRCPLIP